MGFLRSILGKDWVAELERAKELLAEGDAIRALDVARKVQRRADDSVARRAAGLVSEARAAVRDSVLAKAAAAEAAGDLADAADWLASALEQESSPDARVELEARRRSLLERIQAQETSRRMTHDGGVVHDVAEARPEEIDIASRYELIVDTLNEEFADRYRERSAEFQRAIVDLNEGHAASAIAVLESLVEADPEDPVALFELGRARHLSGDAEGALEAFEAVWQELGDLVLDRAGEVSVPGMWADAALAGERYDEILDRLGELAGSTDREVAWAYAVSLHETGRHAEAAEALESSVARFKRHHEFKVLLAETLVELDRTPEAIEHLEALVRSNCAGGCAKTDFYAPAFRELARLQAVPGGDLERARELMVMVTTAHRGRLFTEDYEVLGQYFEAEGDRRSSEACRAEAERLEADGGRASSTGVVDFP